MTELFKNLQGRWTGQATTHFGPDTHFDDPWSLQFSILPGGRFLLQEHKIQVQGADHQGWLLFGIDGEGKVTTALADTFHTSESGLLVSTGQLTAEGTLSVLGHYQAGDQRWGWRTEMALHDDTLVISVFNISPEGDEYPAIEGKLTRET